MAINSENLTHDGYGYNWRYQDGCFGEAFTLSQLEGKENPSDDDILEAIFNAGVEHGEEKAKDEMRKHLGDKSSEDSWY